MKTHVIFVVGHGCGSGLFDELKFKLASWWCLGVGCCCECGEERRMDARVKTGLTRLERTGLVK